MVDQSDGAQTKPGSHAVVIGGSMAGLLAARVLSHYFDQVTIVDRDHFPEEPKVRKGVPQGQHLHVLLVKGRQILEQLFPGLDAQLVGSGVKPLEWGIDSVSLLATGWVPRFHSGLVSYTVSRPYLEWAIRCQVAADPKVRFIEGCDVTDLVASVNRTRITGIKLNYRRGATGDEVLHADLVVDASGRDSHTPEWLTTLDYETPEKLEINPFIGYASRLLEAPAHFNEDWSVMVVASRPPKLPRGGVISALENGQWMVTLSGAARDYPPTDEAGFMEFARSLATTRLYETIKDAQPASPIYGYRKTLNQWRYYERLARWPDNFIVTGDAVCAFNPVYGQGMSAAAQDAVLLDTCLREHADGNLTGMARQFQKRLAKSNATPWLLATGEDLRYPTTEGGQLSLMTRLMHRYVDRIVEFLPEDIEASRIFFEVAQLVAPPAALFQPRIVAQVARRAFQKPRPRELVVTMPYPPRPA